MRILIVTHYFYPHTGGIEVVAYNQAKELVRRGNTVTIITSKVNIEKSKEKLEGINIIRVKAWNWLEKKYDVPFPIFSLSLIPCLLNEIKKNDVVHAHGTLYMGSFLSSLITKILKKKFILTEHVGFVTYKNNTLNIIQQIAYNTIGKITLNLSGKVLVLNNKVHDYLSNLTSTKIEYLPNGVDTNLFTPSTLKQKILLRTKNNLPKDRKLVLFVGRFVEKKGVELLIKAKNKAFDIVLVGDGRLPKEIYNAKGFFVYSFMDQDRLKEIYQSCDIFVLPSENEGFPLSLQEAMASGLPIITTFQPFFKEIFDTKLVKLISRDVKQIRDSIQEIVSNPKLLQSMRTYSRETVVHLFSWQINVDKILKIFNEVKNEKN